MCQASSGCISTVGPRGCTRKAIEWDGSHQVSSSSSSSSSSRRRRRRRRKRKKKGSGEDNCCIGSMPFILFQ